MLSLFKALSVGFCLVPFVTAYTYSVDVGKFSTTGQKGIGFDPPEVFPQNGDVISFVFQSGTHSIVESTFQHPCTPNGGFNSGAQTISSSTPLDAPGLPVVEILISGNSPAWYFDGASGECQQGAVFAINPTAQQNFTAFLANAATDATPATSSSGSSATGTTTAASSKKTNAVAKHEVVAGGAALLLLAPIIIGFL